VSIRIGNLFAWSECGRKPSGPLQLHTTQLTENSVFVYMAGANESHFSETVRPVSRFS